MDKQGEWHLQALEPEGNIKAPKIRHSPFCAGICNGLRGRQDRLEQAPVLAGGEAGKALEQAAEERWIVVCPHGLVRRRRLCAVAAIRNFSAAKCRKVRQRLQDTVYDKFIVAQDWWGCSSRRGRGQARHRRGVQTPSQGLPRAAVFDTQKWPYFQGF